MRKPVLALLAVAALAACSSKEDRVLFDGIYFRAKAVKLDKEQPDSFTVTVNNYGESVDAAREAGRYEGTKYCIVNYGTSNIEWSQGPDDEQLMTDGDKLLLAGTCKP